MSDLSTIHSTQYHSKDRYKPWLICLSAGLFFFYEFIQLNVFDVINQVLRRDFNVDATQLGLMSSSFIWANVLFLLPAGFILDRVSVRHVLLLALFICVFGTFGFSITTSFAWASFFHALTGIGNAFCFLSCIILVSRWFPPRQQAFVIGCIVTMAFIGGITAHTPYAYLNAQLGWRRAVFIDGMLGVLILAWIAIVVQDNTPLPTKQKHSFPWLLSFKQSLFNRQNWLVGAYIACLNLPIMVLGALWGGSYLQVVHHLNIIDASNIISFIFIGSIIGCPIVGWLSDKHSKRKPMMILGATATFLTALPLTTGVFLSKEVLIVLFLGLGVFSSTQVIGYPFIAESNSKSNTGISTAIASIIIMGGGGMAQILFGRLMQKHAGAEILHYSIADFNYAMWMFPVTSILACLAALLSRETHCAQL